MTPLQRRVEHVDTDSSGVVHFARYPSLLETAVLENLACLGTGPDALARDGLDLVITECRVRYLAPARFLDLLRVDVAVAHLGAAHFRFSGTVVRTVDGADGVSVATGLLVFGVVNRETATAQQLPSHLRDALRSL
ncbi:acyl-CoA thioesterase [Micromonospora sp. NPDC050276]|uniref:acyl-CoA thioesterase n=1 Tax=Micromonospora sp. NPDC050276 TaxID=3364278 RepID=UPI00378FC01C